MVKHTCNGEVPRHECNSNTNRLLHSEDSTIRRSWCLYCSLNTLRLASKPPSETEGVIKFTLRLEKWLSGLVSNNIGQVIAVITNQLIPLQQTLGTSPWVDFAIGLESLVCCFDSCIGVLCHVVWCSCPYFAVTGVCCRYRLTACDPRGIFEWD